MAKWKHEVDISDIWNSDQSDSEKGYTVLGGILMFVAADAELLKSFEDAGLKVEVETLMAAYEDGDLSFDAYDFVEEFDMLWDSVYEWADDNRVRIAT